MDKNTHKSNQSEEHSAFMIEYRTRGNTSVQGKQKVFVSYALQDRTLIDSVCDDILEVVDCAILFSKEANVNIQDMTEAVGRLDLFVLCISTHFMCGSPMRLEEEIHYAKKLGIPVLPLLLENDSEIEWQERFPQIQYLKKYNNDSTAIPYRKKLSDYLFGVLIRDEIYELIHEAFDAFIFLSYRKKDRKLAHDLMRLIHSNPLCSRVAIWYDEYLIPGESFTEALKRMIESSQLFAMLVTPSLLEDENYVMKHEYPYACDVEKSILPISMAEVDKKQLAACYPGIPSLVSATTHDLSERLAVVFSKIVDKSRKRDPKNTFFIGLAYLHGIEVEEDKKTGVSMISDAAEKGLPEAAEKMSQIYYYGQGVDKDLSVAIDWQKKYRNLLKEEFSDYSDDSINILIEAENNLAEMEMEAGRIKDARNTCWRGIYLCRSNGGYGSFYISARIPYYARIYMLLGDVFLKRSDEKQAIECYSKDLKIYLELSEQNADWDVLVNTCRCFIKLHNMGQIYSSRYSKKILSYLKRACSIRYDLSVYIMLSTCYMLFGDYAGLEAIEYYKQAARISAEAVERHKTADTYSALAKANIKLSNWHLDRKRFDDSDLYLQRALDICQESIDKTKSRTALTDLLQCYYQKMKILRQKDEKTGFWHQKLEAAAHHELYAEAMRALSVLTEEFPASGNSIAVLNTYSAFYEFCSSNEAADAYKKALEIVRANPALYYKDFRHAKEVLWTHRKLEEAYKNHIEFYVTSYLEKNGRFEAYNQSEQMSLYVIIEGEKPSGQVCGMLISEDVLFEIRSEYSWSESDYAYRSCHSLQITVADGALRQFSRKNPTPDEYVYLTLQTSPNKTETVKYIRCYG